MSVSAEAPRCHRPSYPSGCGATGDGCRRRAVTGRRDHRRADAADFDRRGDPGGSPATPRPSAGVRRGAFPVCRAELRHGAARRRQRRAGVPAQGTGQRARAAAACGARGARGRGGRLGDRPGGGRSAPASGSTPARKAYTAPCPSKPQNSASQPPGRTHAPSPVSPVPSGTNPIPTTRSARLPASPARVIEEPTLAPSWRAGGPQHHLVVGPRRRSTGAHDRQWIADRGVTEGLHG